MPEIPTRGSQTELLVDLDGQLRYSSVMVVRLAVLALGLAAVGCIPTAARTNARVEPGFDFALVAGGQGLLEGEDETGATTETKTAMHLEADAQWGWELASGAAVALQLKVPLNFFYITIDGYYQIGGWDGFYMGVGGELSISPAVYLALTKYIGPTAYVTFTPRVYLANENDVAINPQIALGYSGSVDLALFASYSKIAGRGLNVDPSLSSDDAGRDYRDQLALIGAAIRF